MSRGLLMLTVVVLVTPVVAQPAKRPPACSPRFVAQWMNDRDVAFRNLPKVPCTMQGETGIYICDKNGCARP